MTEYAGGTPETIKKLRPDVIIKLYRSGKITQEQMLAADEIRAYWRAFWRMAYRPRVLDGTQNCSGSGRLPLMPQEMMSEYEREIARRYKSWADEMEKIIHHGQTALEYTVAVAVENYGPSQIDNAHQYRRGTTTGIIRQALQSYINLKYSVSN